MTSSTVFAEKSKISLNPIIAKELLELFDSTNTLHKFLFEKKDPQIKSQISQVSKRVEKVISVSKVEEQKGPHLNRILNTIHKELNLAQSVSGEDRIRFLQNAYKQFVMLYQSYEINKKYNVFFCNMDRSVWIQEETKDKKKNIPKNPFQPESHCGRKV